MREKTQDDFFLESFCELMRASACVFRGLIVLNKLNILAPEKRNELVGIAASIEDFAIRMKIDYYG